jgi:hypothetical protein
MLAVAEAVLRTVGVLLRPLPPPSSHGAGRDAAPRMRSRSHALSGRPEQDSREGGASDSEKRIVEEEEVGCDGDDNASSCSDDDRGSDGTKFVEGEQLVVNPLIFDARAQLDLQLGK